MCWNYWLHRDDSRFVTNVDCVRAREEISAAIDNEWPLTPSHDWARTQDHVDSCTGCQRWAHEAELLNRFIRLRPAETVMDRADHITALLVHQRADLAARQRVNAVPMIRIALMVSSIVSVIASLGEFVHSNDVVASAHGGRDLAAFQLAIAIAFVAAAWRPVNASIAALVGLVASLSIVGSVLFDIRAGHTVVGLELHHGLTMFGTALVCALARGNAHMLGRPGKRSSVGTPLAVTTYTYGTSVFS
jgi:hypothetical protein